MTSEAARSRIVRECGLLFLIAAALRLLYWLTVGRVIESPDAVLYLQTADALRSFDPGAADPKLPPLYPLLTALVSVVAGEAERAARCVSFGFSSALVIPVYALSHRLHGRIPARMSALIVATWPWLIDYGSRVATEPLAVFCFVSGVACLVWSIAAESPRRWYLGAAVAFVGLHLTRPEGTFILLAAFIAIAVLVQRREHAFTRYVAPVVGVALGGIVLYALYVHALADTWTLNYRVGFIGEQPENSTVLRDLARTMRAMFADVPAVMLGPLLWILVGVGLFQRGDRPRDARGEFLVGAFVALQWLVVLPVLSPAPRYLMSALVLVALWAGRGLAESARTLSGLGRYRALRWAPAAAVLLFFFGHLASALVGQRVGEGRVHPPHEYKIAGRWMRDHLEPGPILTRKPQVGYYAGMPSMGPPLDASLDEIVAMADRGGFRYVVVDERYSAQMVPALGALLEPEDAPSAFKLVRADLSPYRDARVVVYEIAR